MSIKKPFIFNPLTFPELTILGNISFSNDIKFFLRFLNIDFRSK